MKIKEINQEVFFVEGDIAEISRKDIEFLKIRAAENKRGRVRFCMHQNNESLLQEMLIALTKNTYVQPHKHLKKGESFHIIEGKLKVVLFDEQGKVYKVINMGDSRSPEAFYYKLSRACYHTVIPLSDFVFFHETTNGPFKPEETVYAEWAPSENEPKARKDYLNKLMVQLEIGKNK